MKVPEQWLREWVDPPVTADVLAEQLTRGGLEVDSIQPVCESTARIVVARIESCEPHPGADRLQVCVARTGKGETHQIVCGAPNARPGLLAPLALPGAKLPGGTEIQRAELRGVESHGMLCSAPELGLGEDRSGLMELPEDAPVGASLAEYLQLDDQVLDIDLTPNRGDCLSIEGIAREAAIHNRLAFQRGSPAPIPPQCDDRFAVYLDAPEDCPRYVGRVVKGIDPAAQTPLWLKERLRRAGSRSLGPVVDVTNYVMLELGQPMHAFDLDKLHGSIHVRRAAPGERLVLLDGSEVELTDASLVIADEAAAVALAGVMGGQESAVGTSTTSIFFESAWFEPDRIRLEARRLRMHTDASHRFERVVATDGQARAVERATRLLVEIAGGEPGPLIDTRDDDCLPQPAPIRLRASRIERILGMPVDADEVESILTRLGLTVSLDDSGWTVTPPAYRPDLGLEIDLIEEIARIRGLDSFTNELPSARLALKPRPETVRPRSLLRDRLVARGYQEVITYSFVDSALQQKMFPGEDAIALRNPISSDMDVMRLSLWPGLLQTLVYNLHRQQNRMKLLEIGRVFPPPAGPEGQPVKLAGIGFGPGAPAHWDGMRRGRGNSGIDFFDLRSDVEALLDAAPGRLEMVAEAHPALHPGQSARVQVGERAVGWLGTLHPNFSKLFKIPGQVIVFELNILEIEKIRLPAFAPVPRFPSVRRDLAVIVSEDVSAADLRAAVARARVDVLQELEFFDVYRGEGIDSGKKSIALSLTFQASSRTLEDSEVDQAMAEIGKILSAAVGGMIRGA